MTNQAENFHGNSGDHYLSIGHEKCKFRAFSAVLGFLGLAWAQKWAWPHACPYGSGVDVCYTSFHSSSTAAARASRALKRDTLRVSSLGSQNPAKKLTHWVDLLRKPLTRNHVSEIWRPEPPAPHPS